ncbi:hypothetical protein B0A52_04597 [Exophiala mesophila]|uniref:Transcription factor domain-containing protein n=1 Tax=Exophiala mesophila TaxID=212818 RepID=A0A438N8S4_EXOME|nr:hypothetical protein B0A52_04597 [Exophiala mesophila]
MAELRSKRTTDDMFILATDRDSIKPDASARKLIRRHVMKGKNRKAVPRLLMVMQKTMYPPAIHATLIPRDNSWMEDLKSDPLYADTIIETSQTYFHVFQHRVLKPDALRHMNRALVHLQGKLGEASPVITDSIIFLVLALGMLMEELGDFETARKHIRGLHQLIKFRGGMKALGEKRALQIKCCRLDLRFAMKTGSKPLFFNEDNMSQEPYFASSRSQSAKPMHEMCDPVDHRLSNVWNDLEELSLEINLAHQTGRYLSPHVFQEILISAHYRLQTLEFAPCNLHELFRVTMMAFSATMFISCQDPSAHYGCVAMGLRQALLKLDTLQEDDRQLRLSLWVIMIARVSVLDQRSETAGLQNRLLKVMKALRLTSWHETRQVLKGFLWVNLAHDQTAKSFVDGALNSVANA